MKALRIIVVILLLYVLSYSILSVCGRYQPDSYDLRGPMHHSWAPFGFYDPDHPWPGSLDAVRHPSEQTGGWSQPMTWGFLLLWQFDNHFVHKGY